MTAEVLQLCGQRCTDPSAGKGNTAALRVVTGSKVCVLGHLRLAKESCPSPSFSTWAALWGETRWLASCQFLQRRKWSDPFHCTNKARSLYLINCPFLLPVSENLQYYTEDEILLICCNCRILIAIELILNVKLFFKFFGD